MMDQKWVTHYSKHSGFSSELSTELLYETVIPLQEIYPKELKRDIQTNPIQWCSQQHYVYLTKWKQPNFGMSIQWNIVQTQKKWSTDML